MNELNRRTFLRSTGVAALAATIAGCKTTPEKMHGGLIATTEEAQGLGSEDSAAPTMSNGRPALRVRLREAGGSPLDPERLRLLHVRDLNNDPLPQSIVTGTGVARIELANEPIQISCRLKVPKFGEVYCYADNDGRGYTKAETIDFVVDAAKTRLRRVREAHDQLRRSGVVTDPAFANHMEAATGKIPASATSLVYEHLMHSLWAGEILTLAAAKYRIAKLSTPRKDFKFGVMISGYANGNKDYEARIREVFNFATVCWYSWKNEEPPEQRIDYGRMDGSIQWCLERNIIPKTFGYCYMARGATPEWIRPVTSAGTTVPATQPDSDVLPRQYNSRWSYDRLKELYTNVVRTTMARYKDKPVPYAEIMNEAHDKANLWHMDHEHVLDMAKSVFAAAREANPTIKRQMNHCCLWAEYGKRMNSHGERCWSPFQFIKTCFDNGIDYETIGLQLYYPQHDLFEIERMLDRFAIFNKPIHITELATASEPGLDPTSMRPKTSAPGWHGEWSPTTQADWTEAIYTLCYSKPYFEEVGWWDLTDVPGHFWPFGGLLDVNMQPKESYLRLKSLQKQWGVGPSA